MQLELFDTVDVGTIELEDIFSAYYECRKNKRLSLIHIWCKPKNNDSSDALAMAICHNSYRTAR